MRFWIFCMFEKKEVCFRNLLWKISENLGIYKLWSFIWYRKDNFSLFSSLELQSIFEEWNKHTIGICLSKFIPYNVIFRVWMFEPPFSSLPLSSPQLLPPSLSSRLFSPSFPANILITELNSNHIIYSDKKANKTYLNLLKYLSEPKWPNAILYQCNLLGNSHLVKWGLLPRAVTKQQMTYLMLWASVRPPLNPAENLTFFQHSWKNHAI